MRAPRHIPVLLSEVLEALAPRDGALYIDGTFGAGGYTRAILAAADCRVLALDRDPAAVAAGAALVAEMAPRLTLVESRFSEMERVAAGRGLGPVSGIVLDVGVSSMQIDEAERGFSFQQDGPLDMRMSASGPTAADIVNTWDEGPLADLLFTLGDERRSRAIARAIVRARQRGPLTRTLELAAVVSRVLGPRQPGGLHPATRTFQALRIEVNDELGELTRALEAAERLLTSGGRLAVVSFHSLEDGLVKRYLQRRAGRSPRESRHAPGLAADSGPQPSFRLLNHRPAKPSEDEIRRNPRARSARLRAAERTEAPPIAD
ncbi:MAG: 16S rRNA (cytosine(1402)-N(4))-methyltransferase RsmH [Hyphomicrobiaceae bacterium]